MSVGLLGALLLTPFLFIAGMLKFYAIVLRLAFEVSLLFYRKVLPSLVSAIRVAWRNRNA